MPSFADDIVLAILALLLFGPKKLPVLARELGKWVAEFRRASNEFKYQMEEELRQSEQAERQKQLAAIEASAPTTAAPALAAESAAEPYPEPPTGYEYEPEAGAETPHAGAVVEDSAVDAANAVPEPSAPLPIASSGSLDMMPPPTGLPVGRGSSPSANGHESGAEEQAPTHDSHAETIHAD